MRRRSLAKALPLSLLLSLSLSGGELWATPYQIQYGGRLTSSSGSPVSGPINLSLSFFNVSIGGTANQSKNFSNVSLQDGVFSLAVNLTPSEYAQVFNAGDVWIEIQDLTNSKIYPRQHISASPYAFRIPTDGITLSFDSNGQLSVKGLAGSPLPTSTPAPGQVLKWAAGGGWEWGTDESAPVGGVGSSGIADNSIRDVDISSVASIDQSKIANLGADLAAKEPAIAAGSANQYWTGNKSWATLDTSAVLESSNLYFTNDRARSAISSVSPVVYNTASGEISLPQASSMSSGYLSAQDWLSFNSKTGSQWSTNGSNISFGDGNVGVGTLSPARRLDLESNSPYQLRIGRDGSSRFSYDIGSSGADGLLYFNGNTRGAAGYVFKGVDGEFMRITPSGRVGIGTNTPAATLDVRSVVSTAYGNVLPTMTGPTTGNVTITASSTIDSNRLPWRLAD